MNPTAVGEIDLAPLGVIEGIELKDCVFDETGRVEVAGERMVKTSAARAKVWAVFTRHRLTCVGGVDPAQCGCSQDPDGYYLHLAQAGMDGAIPLRPGSPIGPRGRGEGAEAGEPQQCINCPPGSKRSAPHRGPRCTAHHRQVQARRSQGQCAPCNKYLARIKNSPEAYARGLTYLIDPPARAVLGARPEVDAPDLSGAERASAAASVAEQVARHPGWDGALPARPAPTEGAT